MTTQQSQHSGVKRKSPCIRYSEPPHKRCKYYNKNKRQNSNESLYSESPPLVLFSPQQTSDDDDDDYDYESDTIDSNNYNEYEYRYKTVYNPDIIQGLEFLIPHLSINPFYDPYHLDVDVDVSSSHTELLSSCCVSPKLAFELNETEKKDKNINSFCIIEKEKEKEKRKEGGGPPAVGVIELLSDDDNNDNDNEFMRYNNVIITIGDIGRLRPLTYLNDSIIDFYLKYLFTELLDKKQRDDIHIFTQFFYTKLDSAINKNNENARLKLSKWTKHVNIFEKQLLIVPIHNALHWSLAIVTNPGYRKELRLDTNSIYDICRNEILSIITTQCFNEPQWIHTIQTHPKVLAICNYPSKILHFDSMRGCHPTNDIHNKLRIYLNDEWKRRMFKANGKRIFTNDTIPGISLGVPQQKNSADCGLYLLHFAQLFALKPFYNSGNSITRNKWFTQSDITQKRKDIKDLCVKLRSDQGKQYIDIDKVLQEEEEENEEDDDNEDEDLNMREFEDRLWETSEDILKDKLCTKARTDEQLYNKLRMILDDIDYENVI